MELDDLRRGLWVGIASCLTRNPWDAHGGVVPVYTIIILTATMTGTVLVYVKRISSRRNKHATAGSAVIGPAVNTVEANIRDLTIYFNADSVLRVRLTGSA